MKRQHEIMEKYIAVLDERCQLENEINVKQK